MHTLHPPSLRRQDWGVIVSMATLVFVASFAGSLYLTWQWATDWPPLSQHLPHWGQALLQLLFHYELTTWLAYWQYMIKHDLTGHFAAHLALPAVLALCLAYLTGRLFYVPGGRDRLRHVSGPYLYFYRAAIKHARKQLGKEQRKQDKHGLRLHPQFAITRTRESGNLFVAGSQGTGKTVFITPLIQQVIDRGERCFIYDEKREFTSLFYQRQTCLLIAPWDTRSQAWDIQSDANNASRAQLIAEQLILASDDPLWSNGARMIFTGMVEILNHTRQTWGWTELAETLALDETTLHDQLHQYYPRAARFIQQESKTTQSFFAQLLGSLGWIFTLADAWPKAYKGGFSMAQWGANTATDKPVIIVQADKRYADIGAPLCNALIALMTANILSQPNSTSRELWLFLDELANLPKNESLFDWMSLGRSKGCRIVAGTQSISQLKTLYTDHGADTLLNMFTLFTSMRLGGAGETASYTAKAFGEREAERPTSSAGPQDSPTLNWHRETLPLVSASDLVHLPQANRRGVEGYLTIAGYNAVYRLRWPYPKLPMQADEHCPAPWLASPQHSNTTPEASPASRREQLRVRRTQHVVDERH